MFNGETSLSLDQVYTPCSLVPEIPRYRWIEAAELQRMHQAQPLPPHSPPQPAQDILAQHPRLLIYGQPGTGKTTLLQFLAGQQLTEQDEIEQAPLFIALRQLGSAFSQLAEHPLETLLWQQCGTAGISFASFQQILSAGKLVLLLDGLDEISSSDRHALHGAVQTLAETYPNVRIIMTSRFGIPEMCYQGFTTVAIAELSDRQIATVVERYFTALYPHSEGTDQRIAQHFLAQISQPDNQRLQDLARNPLLLHVLCWVFRDQQEFPQRRSRLYQNILELLLGRWDQLRGIQREALPVSLELPDAITFLSQIASLHWEADQHFFEKADIITLISNYLEQRAEHPLTSEALWTQSDAIFKMLTLHTGLLVEQAHEVYCFAYLALSEYLTARHIVAQTRTQTTLARGTGLIQTKQPPATRNYCPR